MDLFFKVIFILFCSAAILVFICFAVLIFLYLIERILELKSDWFDDEEEE